MFTIVLLLTSVAASEPDVCICRDLKCNCSTESCRCVPDDRCTSGCPCIIVDGSVHQFVSTSTDADAAAAVAVALALKPDAPHHHDDVKLTYLEARALALKESKPLVIWVGGDFCHRCVEDSAAEFVHVFVPLGWEGHNVPTTIVGVPEDGDLLGIAEMTWWVVGDAKHGHVPSIRRALKQWREERRMFAQHAPAMSSSGMMRGNYQQQINQPMMAPMMPMRSSGGGSRRGGGC